jgi:hypothetical protein
VRAGRGHRALLELAEVAGEQREAVGVVAEQVALEQYLGDVLGERRLEARGLEQPLRPGDQRVGVVAGRRRTLRRRPGAHQ